MTWGGGGVARDNDLKILKRSIVTWRKRRCGDVISELRGSRSCSSTSTASTRFTVGNVTVRPGSAEGFLDVSGGGYLHADGERFDGSPFDRVNTVNADDNLLRLESFHTFVSVRRLSLRRNRLKSVKPIDGDLAETLIRLDVSENQLNPDDIYRLSIMSKLEQLYMLANNLTAIPESITNCHCFLSLKLLDLSDNYLSCPRTFYVLSTLHNLQVLNMSNNRISFIPYLVMKQESDYINGKNQTEAYQDNEDMENDKNDDTKEIVYHAYHIPFVSLITINLSNNMLAHNSSVLSLICWPSLKNVILTANTISLNKNLIEFKKLMSTLSVFNIKTKR
ncbi:protein lap1-like [Rhopalosiphum padi]|uniref:protein lap1-like n=1 Tax=Rhopalosiphum padi TaxID=40932 RepID=UPI00298D6ABD|nr:protein lap1-like [Rhopalosiphum padi]